MNRQQEKKDRRVVISFLARYVEGDFDQKLFFYEITEDFNYKELREDALREMKEIYSNYEIRIEFGFAHIETIAPRGEEEILEELDDDRSHVIWINDHDFDEETYEPVVSWDRYVEKSKQGFVMLIPLND